MWKLVVGEAIKSLVITSLVVKSVHVFVFVCVCFFICFRFRFQRGNHQ